MRKKAKKYVEKFITNNTAVLAFAMVFLLCAPFTALGSVDYAKYEENQPKITNAVLTYDDGTNYTEENRYNAEGEETLCTKISSDGTAEREARGRGFHGES